MMLEKELSVLLNRHSVENDSNTPDYVLAWYLISCLDAFGTAVQMRETFFGRTHDEEKAGGA